MASLALVKGQPTNLATASSYSVMATTNGNVTAPKSAAITFTNQVKVPYAASTNDAANVQKVTDLIAALAGAGAGTNFNLITLTNGYDIISDNPLLPPFTVRYNTTLGSENVTMAVGWANIQFYGNGSGGIFMQGSNWNASFAESGAIDITDDNGGSFITDGTGSAYITSADQTHITGPNYLFLTGGTVDITGPTIFENGINVLEGGDFGGVVTAPDFVSGQGYRFQDGSGPKLTTGNLGLQTIETEFAGDVKWWFDATNFSFGTQFKMRSGAGSPNGVVTAPPGSIYFNTSGGTTNTLWVKESGTGNTGWANK